MIVTLHALDRVVFNDDKEGLLGIRVAHWLESANEKGGTFTDANGRPTEVPASNIPGATGVYLTSEGKEGDQAWGTRGRWCALTGKHEGHTATIAIFDHPGQSQLPNLLARPRLRPICRQSTRAAHLRSQGADAGLHA